MAKRRFTVLRKIRYIVVMENEKTNEKVRESKYLFTKNEIRRIGRLLKYWNRNDD